MVSEKAPWKDIPEIWKDERAYFNWLRSQIRRIWSRHPIKIEYKKSRRYKAPIGRNGKEVWVSDCEICGCQSRNTEVDHLKGGYGFHDWETFCEWEKRILAVTFKDIRELCESCHGIVTLSQKLGISYEEANLEKKVIEAMKNPATEQRKKLLGEGFTETQTKTTDKRRECFRELYSKKEEL